MSNGDDAPQRENFYTMKHSETLARVDNKTLLQREVRKEREDSSATTYVSLTREDPIQKCRRQVFWLSDSFGSFVLNKKLPKTFRHTFPISQHTRSVAYVAVVTDYSGASAAGFHGLPCRAPSRILKPETCEILTPLKRMSRYKK